MKMAFLKLVVVLAFLPAAIFPASSLLMNTEKINSWFGLVFGNTAIFTGSLGNTYLLIAAVSSAIGITYLVVQVWRFLFFPIELFRSLGDTGYIPDRARTAKEVAAESKRSRVVGNLPPVYPNGWFHILRSFELKLGEVKFVKCLGENLAVFRGEDGSVKIVDAFCPHLGANLAIGGQVVGDCIQCPFHGWIFRGDDGKCVRIPYSNAIPSSAMIKTWLCLERNESIFMWYHAEGIEPEWFPQEVDQMTRGEWVYRGRTTHMINAHCQEIPENGADLNHLDHLHGSPILAGKDLRYTMRSKWLEIMRHSWDGTWAQDEDSKHIGQLTLKHEIVVLGFKIPLLDFFVSAKQTGPGIVNMFFKSFFGEGIMIHTVTPEEPMLQRVEHSIYGSSFMPIIIAKFFLYAESIQIERDIMIWNHKKYQSKPLLVKEDHLIGKHRRWYSQFYTKNSPRFHDATASKNLEW